MDEPLFERITGHCYSVKNQNGFNGALYDFFKVGEPNSNITKESVRKMIQNFPTQYPTNIVIVNLSVECGRVWIETFEGTIHKTKQEGEE